MNKRIRELSKQAEQYALDKANEANDEDYDYSFDDDFQEKFAELIMQECVKIVRPNSYSRAYPDNMIGGEDGVRLLDIVADQIEEHFDIEVEE